MKNIQIALTALLLTLVLSCNSQRDKAKEMIIKRDNLPSNETMDLVKRYIKQASCIPVGFQFYNAENKKMLDELISKGVIIVTETTEDVNGCQMTLEKVTLTDEGKKYLIREEAANSERMFGEKSAHYVIKTNELAFGEVTGIQEFEAFKAVEASYTLIKANYTPFGKPATNTVVQMKATFAIFDDGWHINPKN